MSNTLTPDRPLNDDDIKILSYYEQVFWETGNLPTEDKVKQTLGVTPQKIKASWQKPRFRQALVARGIDLQQYNSDGVLTPEQLMVANMMLNLHDQGTTRQKLQAAGALLGKEITSQQYHAWLRQPQFAAYLRKRAEEQFKATDSQAYIALMKHVEDQNLNALELFFKMRGIYNPKLDINVNVSQVVTRIIEVVSKHVTDPTTMEAIAGELETLELGPGD